MSDLLGRTGRTAVRLVALAWLLLLAPLEMATTLAGLLTGAHGPIGMAGLLVISLRVAVVTIGLVLGRQLAQRGRGLQPLALAWALADLGTLAIVLTSTYLPSNRAPGDAPVIWFAYALAAAVVVAATRPAPEADPGRRRALD